MFRLESSSNSFGIGSNPVISFAINFASPNLGVADSCNEVFSVPRQKYDVPEVSTGIPSVELVIG